MGWRYYIYPHRWRLALCCYCQGFMLKEGCRIRLLWPYWLQPHLCRIRIDGNARTAAQRPHISSDSGVQYASNRCQYTLAKYNITQSMSRKGDPYANAVAENFFSCLKCELVHLKHYRTRDEAQADIFAYIETFYNTIRPHSGIGWLSPCAYENLLKEISAAWFLFSFAFRCIFKKYCDSFRFSRSFSVYFFGNGSNSKSCLNCW